ncbi:tripartite tricarboxylate transporter substrate binding protein [Variovorax sp. J31P207]|uniref:Bug family tripartite tricarboxylate transporter substrate binding protein n=1 Tax=Variovorax sp. J31P207 TaxID=3053510 RepID=UPI0025786C7D|nr:tripartite tricarboxylate transporter substrate binding protein [Variovorax sp. J31P207]MDM0066796.1 tripartite tricarboxylate transporter substrate binding protein [Variovorax sp. J31P207]
MINRRRIVGALGAVPLAAATFPAWAQGYPSKPIRIVVPLPPGSPPDVLARVVAERLQEAWKQPVVVENRPGATGMIGMDAVAKSTPDGYTVGVMFLTHTVLPALFGKVSYDTAADLVPIANLAWIYNVLVVPTSVPARSAKELADLARAQPGRLTYGSGGNGSPAHLLGESFKQATQADMLHVPYKGPAEAVQALLGGQISAMFATTSVAVPLVNAGKLRALAVTSPNRLLALPSVPTMAESGVPGFDLREWEGIVAPAGTPREIVAKWNDELGRIMRLPAVRDRLSDLGMEAAPPNSPEQFASLVHGELQRWTRFVKATGLKAD